ncbi:MAG: hypothetical protein AAFN77_10815 [Planctomycetota bacterium]
MIAIIVVVAALAVPAVQRTIKSQGIRNGADRIRVAMGQARVKAIRAGEVHAMFYFQNGNWFHVAPLTQFREVASLQSARERTMQTRTQKDLEEDILPQGVQFVAGQTSSDSRSAASMEDVSSAGQGMEMVLFYPDGTSQDAKLTLQNEMGDQWVIELRGLTGTASSMRIDPQSGSR